MAVRREYRNSLAYALIVGWVTAVVVLWISTFISLKSAAAQSLTGQVTELLRTRIEAAGAPPEISAGEEIIHASMALPLFYERRMYRPAWTGDDGPLPQADALLKAISQAEGEGLKPADYHLAKIEATLEQVRKNQANKIPLNPRRLVDLDILFTDAFLVYGSHLLVGRINPETIDAEWLANRRQADLASVLQTALESGQIEETLNSLLPPQPGYARLKQALARYRDMAAKGHWLTVPDGPKMQKGDRDQRVVALRKRLMASGDLDQPPDSNTDLFGDTLEVAVRRFQHRHGLDVDGIVGPATLAALNVPAEERIRQIEINMERWRWLPQNLGQHYVLVNIANFELDVVDNGLPVMTMRVVVGRDYRRTPVFSDKMTYLVLSPYWHVPPKLAIQDKLPLIRKDPDYLVKENIRVFQGWGAETKEMNPASVDWSKVTGKNLNYRLRQEPGPKNALGRVKFMFPNKFDVYLHDTPSRELFAKTVRTFSSGCIRIEKPIELAEYLLAGDPKWSRAAILAAIDKRVEQTVRLAEPMPIHLLYWTAWADEDGSIQFRNDIYGRDRLLEEALREEPPLSF
jgi:murein L,D-transpeptidase YcbB/YkuD